MTLYSFASSFLGFTFLFTMLGALVLLAGIACPNRLPRALKEQSHTWLPIIITGFLTLESIILLYAFINYDFVVKYVYQYSDLTLPIFYRITAFWAGQPGSLLFWAWSVAVSGAAFALFPAYKRLSLETKLWYAFFFVCIMAFFLLLMACWSNPFLTFNGTPPDGQGMNPLLQNPGMIFHPPLLFLGYGGFVVPGCLALAQALSGHLPSARMPAAGQRLTEASWGQCSRPFILLAWALLTAGIVLGAWWAYMELGWGGYWAWDPVENASLIPWLVATAYLHTAVVESKRGKLVRTNVFLMALTTISAFFATYLVRSGVVESLHAFGDGGVGMPLLTFTLASLFLAFFIAVTVPVPGGKAMDARIQHGIMAAFTFLFALFAFYGFSGQTVPGWLSAVVIVVLAATVFLSATRDNDAQPLEDISSKEGLLLMVAWLLLALSFIILIATMWPVIINALMDIAPKLPDAISRKLPSKPMGLEPAFYNRTCLPLFTGFSVLLLFCPFRKWKIGDPALPENSNTFVVQLSITTALSVFIVSLICSFVLELGFDTLGLGIRILAGAALTLAVYALMNRNSHGLGFARPRMLGIAVALAVLFALTLAYFDIRNPVALLAASTSLGAGAGIILYFVSNPGMLNVRSTLAAHGVHLGLLMMILGVAFSGPYQEKYTLVLSRQETGMAGDYHVMLNELYEGQSQVGPNGKPNYIFIEAELLMADQKGRILGKLSPQRRLYTTFDRQAFAEVGTLFSLGNEIYATLLGIDEQNRATIALNVNPLVNWLWIGGTLMCLFPFLGFSRKGGLRKDEETDMTAV